MTRLRSRYGELLKVYFAVAHDPTELNFQGPDHGTQYRSAIFYANEEQKKIATAYIKQLDEAGVFCSPDRHASGSAKRILRCGELPSALSSKQPDGSLYRLQRYSEAGCSEEAVSADVPTVTRPLPVTS